MENFYRNMRKTPCLDGWFYPTGNQWNFDHDNRKNKGEVPALKKLQR
jgi:deoxyribodipyrimidine photolyase-related protein